MTVLDTGGADGAGTRQVHHAGHDAAMRRVVDDAPGSLAGRLNTRTRLRRLNPLVGFATAACTAGKVRATESPTQPPQVRIEIAICDCG
jgi:hypothetical protein